MSLTAKSSPKQDRSWRTVLPVHPAAEPFPVMTAEELKTLGTDILKNGFTSPIVLWRPDPKSPAQLLDGRNRLDAIEMATGKPVEVGTHNIRAGEFLATGIVTELDGRKVDPWDYAVSANIHRRHLTTEQRQHALITFIARAPEKSDRQLGKEAGVDHKTIASARAKGEDVGSIPHIPTRTDTKGRQQPARKRSPRNMRLNGIRRAMKLGPDIMAKITGTALDSAAEMDALILLNRGEPEGESSKSVKQLAAAAAEGQQVSAVEYIDSGAAFRGEDISSDSASKTDPPPPSDDGPNSASEAERLRAHNEQPEAENARLQAKIAGLKSEIADLKAAAKSAPASKSGSRCSICHETKPATLRPAFICDECVRIFDVREAMPTPDDGLDIPAPLRREEMPS
jgi:hypothetical protein